MTLHTSTAPIRRADSSCGLCGKLNQCRTCWNNDWLDAHTCRWCNKLNEDGEGHEAPHGHFCGTSTDSICKHLFYEWLAQRMWSHMGRSAA